MENHHRNRIPVKKQKASFQWLYKETVFGLLTYQKNTHQKDVLKLIKVDTTDNQTDVYLDRNKQSKPDLIKLTLYRIDIRLSSENEYLRSNEYPEVC